MHVVGACCVVWVHALHRDSYGGGGGGGEGGGALQYKYYNKVVLKHKRQQSDNCCSKKGCICSKPSRIQAVKTLAIGLVGGPGGGGGGGGGFPLFSKYPV